MKCTKVACIPLIFLLLGIDSLRQYPGNRSHEAGADERAVQ